MSILFSLSISADLKSLHLVREFLKDSCDKFHAEADVISDLELAVDEAVTNIIIHGYENNPGDIEVVIQQNSRALKIDIFDRAKSLKYSDIENADLDALPFDPDQDGGYGVFLIRKLTDELEYRTLDDGRNKMSLIKYVLN